MRGLWLLALMLGAVVAHADLYRWTDADGVVHYADHPPPQGAERIEEPPPPSPLSAEEAQQRIERLRAGLRAAAQERADAKAKAAEEQQAAARHASECRQARAQLAAMESARRVTGPDGKTYWGEERLKQMEALRAAIREACDQPATRR